MERRSRRWNGERKEKMEWREKGEDGMERKRRRWNGERKEKMEWRDKGIVSKFIVEPDEAVVEVVHLV